MRSTVRDLRYRRYLKSLAVERNAERSRFRSLLFCVAVQGYLPPYGKDLFVSQFYLLKTP